MPTFRWTPESSVEIHARSTLHPIHARIDAVSGEASGAVRDGAVDLSEAPSGFVEVAVDALRSSNPLEDVATRRVVEADRYPTLRYELVSVMGGPGRYRLRGALEMHGVRRELDAEVTVTIEDDVLTVQGEHTFDVRDFGVSPPRLLGLKVHPDVRVVAHLIGRA